MTFIRLAGHALTERSRFGYHLSENHIGVVDKIPVHRDTVFVRAEVYPIRLLRGHGVPLLEEQDVRHRFCPRISPEGILRQADGTDEVCPLCEIAADGGILLIHCPLAREHGNDSAGAHLVERLGKEIIMDEEIVLVILGVKHLELSERDISDCDIEEAVRKGGVLKARDRDILLLIQLLCDTPRNAVQLHTVHTASPHFFRQCADEVADTASRFQNVPATEAHVGKGFVDCFHHDRRRIKSRQGGFLGGFVFFGREQCFQFPIVTVCRVKAIRKTAPTDIGSKRGLLLRCGKTVFGFQLPELPDCHNIGLVLLRSGKGLRGGSFREAVICAVIR